MPSRVVTLAFSLGDPRDRTVARMEEQHGAAHPGLLVVLDDADPLKEVLLWFDPAASLTLIAQNGDIAISDKVRGLLLRYFAVFFDHVKELAPEANVSLMVPRTGDKTLH